MNYRTATRRRARPRWRRSRRVGGGSILRLGGPLSGANRKQERTRGKCRCRQERTIFSCRLQRAHAGCGLQPFVAARYCCSDAFGGYGLAHLQQGGPRVRPVGLSISIKEFNCHPTQQKHQRADDHPRPAGIKDRVQNRNGDRDNDHHHIEPCDLIAASSLPHIRPSQRRNWEFTAHLISAPAIAPGNV